LVLIEVWCIQLQLSSSDTRGCSCRNRTYNYPFQESILALHQLLKEQVDFTQGNNRARVRVVANHPPEYLRRKLSFLYIPFFSRYYQSVETLSIASIGEILRSIPQSALAFHSQCLIKIKTRVPPALC